MKIDKPTSPLPASSTGTARGSAKAGSGKPPAPQQAESTSVSLGSTAAQLQGMANAPAVDSAKIAEIRQAISEGRFKVNSEIVADRLIATVRDLIDHKA